MLSRTTFGSPPKGVPSAVRKGHSTTRCASSWTLAARSVVDAKVTASPAAGSRRETKCRVVSKAQLYTASWGFVRKGHSTTRCASSWTLAARSVVDAKVTASPAASAKCRVVSKAQLYTASWGFDPSALLRQSRILLELPALPFRRSYDALGGSWGKTEFRTSRV